MTAIAASERTDPLDVLVELLSELDGREGPGTPFYDRICEAVCRLTSMRRAGLFLYNRARRLVVAVGSHGVDPVLLAEVRGTLEETPIAQRALAGDRVVEASEQLELEVPHRYARFAGVTTLTCIPVAAGGRWLGVIFADRGGGHFRLTDEERELMWAIGKTAALAASARIATSQEARARLLAARAARGAEGLEVPLSHREREVLELMATGATNREIAGRLHLSPHTVKEHTSSLYRKLRARNRTDAVQRAERLGLSPGR